MLKRIRRPASSKPRLDPFGPWSSLLKRAHDNTAHLRTRPYTICTTEGGVPCKLQSCVPSSRLRNGAHFDTRQTSYRSGKNKRLSQADSDNTFAHGLSWALSLTRENHRGEDQIRLCRETDSAVKSRRNGARHRAGIPPRERRQNPCRHKASSHSFAPVCPNPKSPYVPFLCKYATCTASSFANSL